ncbi:molybdopterin molybdotransferase MoeA [Chlorobium phaeobacteroides]|uniref:Molybdopterin molybdenumtransferase n=1 Tax=Chlorobium phaeobacteroides (strain DSM 266 / SMG 266 / 2430) TaxID=290317 RepID=A1BJ79_CHLPD|nr:gephyrin-like molybdotransferase Glp [Chlorobium phaeobacteroides]ABL66456.1 molybdopterin molybdochelatase [Chlorobium phaeobacteroides DSM 266]
MMITVQEAFRIVTESVLPIVAEKLSLPYLQGRMLAEDVAAPFPLPRFTNAAMDGFALRMDDISGLSDGSPSRLTITQEIAAGALSSFPVFSGCCAQIMTGAPMPEGADTVVPFEDTSGFDGESVLVYKAPKPKANVRYRGEEVCEGELLLRKGTLVTPAEIAVLASFGFASALVSGLPKVAILTVGDELRMPGDHAENAAIYNCNQFMLEAACRASGVGITVIGHAPDERNAMREALRDAMAGCDLLLTAGGISTGRYDFMQELLEEHGVERKFWTVAQKPGKPLYFGITPDKRPVFALPGNPVSAMACFIKYVVPALSRLQGKELSGSIRAELVKSFVPDRKRHRFLFGKVWQENDRLLCCAASKVESHMITALCGANCLLESDPSGDSIPVGTTLNCTMLPWATFSSLERAGL